jgi:threonine dehydratase
VEGAAGVAVAAYLKRQADLAGKNVVLLICGGNMATSTLREVLA